MQRISHDVTHDLRNVFAIIIGNCELAAQAPEGRHILRIRAAADRATALLESDSSDDAKVDFGQPVDLNLIAREVSDMLRSTLVRDDKVRLTLDLAAVIPQVLGSSLWMFLSVFNLCLNARDAMIARGGSLHIATRPAAIGVEMSISDTGKGMSAARLRSLWKARPSPDRKHGHGLQIVKVTMTRMKGKVDVQSKPGAGTTFRITLPAI